MIAYLRHIPVVISIQDIYPESIVSQGRMRANGWLARWIFSYSKVGRSGTIAQIVSETSADSEVGNCKT